MTRPRGELMTYRARGGNATDWANPTRSADIFQQYFYKQYGYISQPLVMNRIQLHNQYNIWLQFPYTVVAVSKGVASIG